MALGELSRSVRIFLGQIQRCRPIVVTNQTGKLFFIAAIFFVYYILLTTHLISN